MKITMIEYPTAVEWMRVKKRALVTVGKTPLTPPDEVWESAMLRARHSPIRYIRFSFLFEDLPYWVSVHLCRHTHAQPYVSTQRNDRQNKYDRRKAPQDSPVDMIWDMNAEELMTIANKRLCNMASKETREVVQEMCRLVIEKCPEFEPYLVPMCEYTNGCLELNGGCGRWRKNHA